MYGHVITKFCGMGRFTKLWGYAHARAGELRYNVYPIFYLFRNKIFRRPHTDIKACNSVLLGSKSSRIRVVTSFFGFVFN